jgi:hypothetical protein
MQGARDFALDSYYIRSDFYQVSSETYQLYATRDARSSLAVRAADRYDHRRRDP